MTRFFYTCCLLLLTALAAGAQTTMRFAHITSGNGLCNDYIKCIYQDHTGFVWLGTYDGLCRYDGANFITYRRDFTNPASLPSNTIYDVKEDPYGILWISTGKGLCYYDPATKKITRITLRDCGPVFYCFGMQVTGDHLWLPTGTALFDFRIAGKGRLVPGKKYDYPQDAKRQQHERLYLAPKGQLYLCVYGNVFFVDRQAAKLEQISFATDEKTAPDVAAVAIDKSGRLWISHADKPMISCYAINASGAAHVTDYALPPGNAGSFHTIRMVTGIGGNAAEKILAATETDGAYLFDPATASFTHISNDVSDMYSLSNDLVTGALQDASGLLWITTAYGANIYDPAQQQLQTVFLHDDEKLPGLLTDALPDNNYACNKITWLGTEQQELVRYDGNTGAMQHYPLPGAGDRIQYLYQQPDGTLWIGGYRGLYRLQAGSGHVAQIQFGPEAPFSISCIRPLPGNDLLITSFENGVWIYRPESGTLRHFTTKNGLFSNRCTYISGGSNNVFYLTHIAPGLSVLNLNDSSIEKVNFQPFLEQELSYPASFTYCSYPDTNGKTLWIGTGLGLVRYDLQSRTGKLLAPTTRLNTDNEIWSVIPGSNNCLWLKTTFGVYRFDRGSLTVKEFYTLERKHIPSQAGYFRMRTAGDALIIPAYRSFHLLQMQKHGNPVATSRIVLLDAWIDGKKQSLGNDTGAVSLVLQQGQTSLALNFTSLNFRHPEFSRYSYRLYGADEHWYSLGDKTSLSFANLKPGDYTLHIVAKNYDPETVIKPLLAHITVKPYFWQTAWFYILLLVTAVLALYGLYRYRISQVMAVQRMRQKISKDLHDDIGATISSIGLLAAMANTEQVPAGKKKQFLETIIDQSHSVSQSLSDIVWSINPQNDQLDVVFARIQRFASELFEAQNISYDIVLPKEQQLQISLPMIARQHIYLVFKEAINNIIKYAAARSVQVQVAIVGKAMQVLIRDDGKGFDMQTAQMGNGIYNMKKRVAELKGDFIIETAPGKGTAIKFTVSL